MGTRVTDWRKSSHSHFEENACVEVGHGDGIVGVRDTKEAAVPGVRPVLLYPADAFAAFLDHLTQSLSAER
jgi:hypothetical protein